MNVAATNRQDQFFHRCFPFSYKCLNDTLISLSKTCCGSLCIGDAKSRPRCPDGYVGATRAGFNSAVPPCLITKHESCSMKHARKLSSARAPRSKPKKILIDPWLRGMPGSHAVQSGALCRSRPPSHVRLRNRGPTPCASQGTPA